jgi:hypothetical protein
MDGEATDADRYSTRVELLAIPVVAVIFGIGALVMFAAVEGPWAWIVVGIGLLILLVLAFRYAQRRYPHMWDEAPANETSSKLEDD